MSKNTSIYLVKLTEFFERLPGIGKKTAQKLAFSVLKMPKESAQEFAKSIIEAHEKVHYCSLCYSFTDKEICDICTDNSRDKSIICVVEDTRDVEAIERTHEYTGLYHVLHGVISPLNGIGPDEIKIKELLNRLKNNTIKEIIMATNPTVEGEATAMYISRLLKPLGVVCSRLAYGIPMGADLEYADDITLTRAIDGRSQM